MSETKYRDLMNDKPEFAVRHAITGMLPKGPLGRQMAKKLFVYARARIIRMPRRSPKRSN